MTSLASQLKALAVPHTQALLGDERKRVSLLFEPTEAANLDREAVFAIGLGGLEELIEINSVFMEYEKTLFNESATNFQRLTQSSEVNKKIDETVRVYLIHLSPYFLLRPAQKTLEWLIYRYQIHFYNVDDLLLCAMPYHDSNMFTRLVQILNISSPKSKWHWMEPIQKHGTQLPCQTIATHAYKDEGFLNFVASVPEHFIQVHGAESSGNHSPVHAAISFYTKVVLTAIQEAQPVKESFIAQLTVFILRGLKSKNSELKCATYMILSTLCNKVELDSGFLENLLPLLTKRMMSKSGFEAISTLVLIFKTQKTLTALPKRCLKHISRLPGVVQHLTQLHEWGVLDILWPHLLKHLVPAAIKECRMSVTSSSDGGGQGSELIAGRIDYWALLDSLLTDCQLSDGNAQLVIKLMCDGYVENKAICHTEESSSLLAERVQAMLRLMEQKYSDTVDSEIRKQMSVTDNNEVIQEFAMLSLSSFKYRGDNLVLSLNHVQGGIRCLAVQSLIKLLNQEDDKSIDWEFTSFSLYSRLLDDDSQVVDCVLAATDELLVKYLTPKQLISAIKIASRKIVRKRCTRLLTIHPDVSSFTNELQQLVLIAASQNQRTTAEILTTKADLELFRGCDELKDDWKVTLINTAASNLVNKNNITDEVNKLCSDNSGILAYMVCKILVASLNQFSKSDDNLREILLNILMEKCQLMTAKNENNKRNKSMEVFKDVIEVFNNWPSGWYHSKSTTKHFVSFMSLMMSQGHSQVFITAVKSWLACDKFDQSMTTLLSMSDDALCVNSLHLLKTMCSSESDGTETLKIMTKPHSLTVGCLVSLLTSNQKLIRKTIYKIASLILDNCEGAFPLKKLVSGIVDRSEEIEAYPNYITEVVTSVVSHNKPTFNRLLEMICQPSLPEPMALRLLTTLESYQDISVLEGIQPIIKRLLDNDSSDLNLLYACINRHNDNSVKEFCGIQQLWDNFIRCLSTGRCQIHALSVVTPTFFKRLKDDSLRLSLLKLCLDIYLQSEDVRLHSAVSELIKRVKLPAAIIKNEFEGFLMASSADQTIKTKKLRRSQHTVVPTGLNSKEWRRVRLLLEWLETKKNVTNSHVLVAQLFKFLSLVLEMTEESGTDYMKHLLLSCIEAILNKLKRKSQTDLLTDDQINMELIVQCIRTSKNPQTHQEALLLLKTASSIFPEVVLHHIMSIFTYMGANIMRQDDMYSFQIISKTLDNIVPELVKTSGNGSEYTITSIIRVFVDAYPHIPEHRRLPLFSKLLNTLGASKYLYACACLCIESLTTSTPPSENNEYDWQSESNQLPFLLSLFSEFEVNDQLEACTRMLDFLCQLPVDTSKFSVKRGATPSRKAKKSLSVSNKSTIIDGLFDVSVHTDKQLRHFKYENISFLVSLIMSDSFVEQVVNVGDGIDLAAPFNNLIAVGLRYITLVAKETEQHTQQPTHRFWKALLHKAYEVLDKVNALLPASVFIRVIQSLLAHDLHLVRRKAMDLLNNRLPQTTFSSEEVTIMLELLPQIKAVALDQASTKEESEDSTNRQTALYSLKIMTRILCSADQSPFIQLLTQICDSFDADQLTAVKANLLLLIGELIFQLNVSSLPFLPKVLPKLIEILKQEENLASNHLLWISAITSLHKIIETIPNFLSQYLQDIIVIVSMQSSVTSTSTNQLKGYKGHLPLRLKQLRECLSKEFTPRVLVPVITKSYGIISHNSGAVESLMNILAEHVEHISQEDLSTYHHKLVDLFIMALDFRATRSQAKLDTVLKTEDVVIAASIKMIVKLSEAAFRPMYFKLYGWATRESDVPDRLITFYRLSDSIAEKLRGLFSLFASHIVKNAADILSSTSRVKPDVTGLFDGDTHQLDKEYILCTAVVDCLHKCFLYDTEGFVTKQRFNTLMQPLVDQVENKFTDYSGYVKNHIVPCISQFAVAAADDSLWKPLIYQVCLKTRHQSAQVRKGSLYLLRAFNNKLGEDFMPLLPETIPFLAELMEDDEEEVETLCQEVIADMEKTLGEPLQKYF